MSIFDNKGLILFPYDFIKQCVETYTLEHGKPPKVLVVSNKDLIDWVFGSWAGKHPVTVLGMTLITGDYLKPGEIDLAQGIVES
jgi:hypothetical protein